MIVCISTNDDGTLFLQLRAEGDGDLIGDAHRDIAPGEDFFGHSFADLKALGEGEHDISPQEQAT